jgi:hypothetical protein
MNKITHYHPSSSSSSLPDTYKETTVKVEDNFFVVHEDRTSAADDAERKKYFDSRRQ